MFAMRTDHQGIVLLLCCLCLDGTQQLSLPLFSQQRRDVRDAAPGHRPGAGGPAGGLRRDARRRRGGRQPRLPRAALPQQQGTAPNIALITGGCEASYPRWTVHGSHHRVNQVVKTS